MIDENGNRYIVSTHDGLERCGVKGDFDVLNCEEPKPYPDVDVPPTARGDQPASSMTIRERLGADFMSAAISYGRFRTACDALAYADEFLAELKEGNDGT